VTRAGRWLRKLLERVLGQYREGPEPPSRLAEEVRLFVALYQGASQEDWIRFATSLANNAYRDGYVRGFEYSERSWPGPIDDPETLLEVEASDVSLLDHHPRLRMILELGYDPMDPLAGMSASDRAVFMDTMAKGAKRGLTFRRSE
jgi:hypothetical protein